MHDMTLSPCWPDLSEPFDQSPSCPLDGHDDEAVVGGGSVGFSAALALARKGASVAELEAATIGNAASGRNCDPCNNGLARNCAATIGRFAEEKANALCRAFDPGRRHGRAAGVGGRYQLRLRAGRHAQAGRHGTHIATLMGRIMADVMDGKPALNPWNDFSGQAIPGYFGRRWFPPIHGAITG